MIKDDVKRSKFLSRVLRHDPQSIGIYLDPNGWVGVEELIDASSRKGVILDRDTIERIVETNDKKRFAFSEDKQKIRANQGHSISIDLRLEPMKPPDRLYHGTASRFLPSIRIQGLQKGKRHHVHLSNDLITARQVGERHGKPVIIQILAKEMHQDGFLFFRSANGVWLTDFVPINYIKEVSSK